MDCGQIILCRRQATSHHRNHISLLSVADTVRNALYADGSEQRGKIATVHLQNGRVVMLRSNGAQEIDQTFYLASGRALFVQWGQPKRVTFAWKVPVQASDVPEYVKM